MASTSTSPPPPGLTEASKKSTVAWQTDLESLFQRAKDRFPDVLWELLGDDDGGGNGEEVWGHKAIVYARAPPSFQARYFSFRPAPIGSPRPYSPSGYPTQSALSLTLGVDLPTVSRSPSPFRPASPISTTRGGILRLTTSINPTLFSKELEYLYTGKGIGAAFEFLYDSNEHYREEGDAEENRIDKLRKDLVFMWRSRLYSDVRVIIEGSSSAHHEGSAAVFTTHRFILVSRSSYFYNALIGWNSKADDDSEEPPSITLPSPPFTPPALHFILGFIYTGTLIFSNRTYDLDTAFAILRSSAYIALDTLFDEIQARIVQEMMHGLFHAFLEFAEYERLTGGKWGVSGCRCRQCSRRVPRVLEFALQDDVKNVPLERGARRGLVGLFGDGWCNADFARLDKRIRDAALKGVAKRTTPLNVFPLLFAAEAALARLETLIDPWADVVRDMIIDARHGIDRVLCDQAEECFEQSEWLEVMEANGARFEDTEHVEWVMKSVQRGFADKNAGTLYQVLVSSILLRPHPIDINDTLLPSTSAIRVQVEDTRVELLRWMRKRWVGVRQEGGFDTLDGWALKEISHEIEVPVEDLTSPSPTSPVKGSPARNGIRSTVGRPDNDNDTISMHSLRTSVLNRNMAKHNVPASPREPLTSSGSSVRSVARSTYSTTSRVSSASTAPRRVAPSLGPRPDSKLTPSGASVNRVLSPTPRSGAIAEESSENARASATDSSSIAESSNGKRPRPSPEPKLKSSAASVTSVRSRASTVRKPTQSTPTPSLRVPSVASRPASAASRPASAASRPASSVSRTTLTVSRPSSSVSTHTSDTSSTFKSAKSELAGDSAPRARRVSASSTVSTASVRTTATSAKPTARRLSTASTASTNTINRPKKTVPPLPDTSKLSQLSPTARKGSSTSIRSTASASPSTLKKVVPRKAASPHQNGDSPKGKTPQRKVDGTSTIKGKGKAPELDQSEDADQDTASLAEGLPAESVGVDTPIHSQPQRRGSSDTITRYKSASEQALLLPVIDPASREPRGATLEIGIPCIITSKRARFRAYARYIGEVEGEAGPWVGVEVPISDPAPSDKPDIRQWHDGSWGGVRYFDLGVGSEWDYSDERGSRRRRLDWIGTVGTKTLKREGEQLSLDRSKRLRSVSPAVSDVTTVESRGLFVRPQQVLYVVDAVGSEL
ncbi:hypothetical protein FA95DRAFT_1554731 [Auriscalpium vulgare]|uniref:Uncharacterized protein n=1 Tax=Auriscalpium vulgare TaxID=40419 RepID=A0ACB8S4V1_9AGAM|nr:hypothetical protein FA95DRAFT_1554731 [Auriscalpium vulgare]